MAYTRYLTNKKKVLKLITPLHTNVFASHVTYEFGVPNNSSLPLEAELKVVGYACDKKAQAFVVSVNGSIYRPDGNIYHLTISTANGVKPVYSNVMLESGWVPIFFAISIQAPPDIVNR